MPADVKETYCLLIRSISSGSFSAAKISFKPSSALNEWYVYFGASFFSMKKYESNWNELKQSNLQVDEFENFFWTVNENGLRKEDKFEILGESEKL